MTCSFATLMPHPPILVPKVGKGREQEAAVTLQGIQAVQKALYPVCANPQTRPEFLLLLSPHQPYARGALFLNDSPTTSGSFAHFGAPDVTFQLETPLSIVRELQLCLEEHHIPVVTGGIDNIARDHAAFVPLYFLQQCFAQDTLPPVLVASPIGLSYRESWRFGQALRSFISASPWGFIASGDLSHRLTPNAPAGFSPAGAFFDNAIVEALRHGTPEALLSLPPETIEQAGECGLRSVLALLGFIGASADVLSYEGPFGVGYCTALWQPEQKTTQDAPRKM